MTCVTKALNKFRRRLGEADVTSMQEDAKALGQTEKLAISNVANEYLDTYQAERADIIALMLQKFPKRKEKVRAAKAAETPMPAVQEKTQPEQPLQAAELTPEAQDWYNKYREDNPALVGKYPAEAEVMQRDRWLENAIELASGKVRVTDAKGIDRTLSVPEGVHRLLDISGIDTQRPREQVLADLKAKMDSPDAAVSPREQQSRVERMNAKMDRARRIATILRNDSEAAQWLSAMERAKTANKESEFNTEFRKLLDAEESQSDARAERRAKRRTADIVDEMEPGVDYGYDGVEGIDFSKTTAETYGTTGDAVYSALQPFFTKKNVDNRVTVTTSDKSPVEIDATTQAITYGGKVWMFVDRIVPGTERAVFLHEVGGHLGMKALLGADLYNALGERLLQWSQSSRDTQEVQLAKAAMKRVNQAGTDINDQTDELIAYFIEEAELAGVKPTTSGVAGSWIKRIFDAMGAALRRLADQSGELTANDVMTMAYGAADLGLYGAYEETIGGETFLASKVAKAEPISAAYARVVGPSGVQLWDELKRAASVVGKNLSSLPDLVRDYEGKIPELRPWLKSLRDMSARKIELDRRIDAIIQLEEKLSATERKDVNEFIYDSTTNQKWGYDPEFGRKVEVNAEYAVKFGKLSKDAQAVVKAVFKHGEDMMQLKREVFKGLGVKDVFARLTSLEGPYAPLMRFGKFMVEVKSPWLVAETDDKKIDALKRDPRHYEISFHDTEGQAKRRLNELLATGNYDKDPKVSYTKERPVSPFNATEMPASAMAKVLAAVKADEGLDKSVQKEMRDMVTSLYHTMMEDHIARNSMRLRKYRHGADTDMLRAFVEHGRSEAAFLANMEFGQEVNEATKALEQSVEGGKGAGGLQSVVNAALEHRKQLMKYEPTPIQDFTVGMTSTWQLLTSLGYHLTNATQVAMKSQPMIAAEFGDYNGAWRHVSNGYKMFGTMRGDKFDFAKVKDAGLRKMFEEAERHNLIDIGMADDLDQYSRFTIGIASIDAVTLHGSRAIHKLRQISRAVERMNRIAAASAAYTMSIEKGRTAEQAQDFAMRVLEQTQGDMTQLSAPLAIKKLPKFLTQYRKYQLMVAGLYVRAARDAFAGETPEVKAVGKRMLGFMLAHTAVAGGLLGLPLMNLAQLVIPAIFGDDDEPKDLERMARDFFGDNTTMADVFLKGPLSVLLGLDMSAKLGDDRVFSILPYTDVEFSKKGLANIALGLAGPAASQVGKFMDGVGLIQEGELAKGIEKFTPKGIEDALKNYRIANEGVTLRNGDIIVKPEDISAFQTVLAGLGLPAAEIKKYQWLQSQQIEITKFYRETEQQLKKDYIKASKAGDYTTMAELRTRWMDLQSAKPKMRVYFGNQIDELKASPIDNLLRAPQKQREREAKRQETFTEP